jgi:hypothetical protein
MHQESPDNFQEGEEFALEVLASMPLPRVAQLMDALQRRRERLLHILSAPTAQDWHDAGVLALLQEIFGARRRAAVILETMGTGTLLGALERLVRGHETVSQRLELFCEPLASMGFEGEAVDIAGELLHFYDPERYWLWTRWIWNPRTQSGALALLIPDWSALLARTPGETYLKVGEATAYVAAAAESQQMFKPITRKGRFAPYLTDIYLAMTYTLYSFTVLRMRMTKEFTKVFPEPWELVQRLLGVYPLEG